MALMNIFIWNGSLKVNASAFTIATLRTPLLVKEGIVVARENRKFNPKSADQWAEIKEIVAPFVDMLTKKIPNSTIKWITSDYDGTLSLGVMVDDAPVAVKTILGHNPRQDRKTGEIWTRYYDMTLDPYHDAGEWLDVLEAVSDEMAKVAKDASEPK